MQNMKRWLAAMLSGILLLTPCTIFADDEAAETAVPQSSEATETETAAPQSG